jgi:hypothetical protein
MNWFNEERTGRIDEDGNIHKGTNWFNEEKPEELVTNLNLTPSQLPRTIASYGKKVRSEFSNLPV